MNTTSIKFFWNGIKVNGERKLIRCFYSLDNNADGRPNVTIYARDCERLPRDVFVVHNDTDLYTDYFDDDSAELTPEHPLYKYARAAALKAAMRGEPEYIAQLKADLQRPEYWPGQHQSRRDDIERREKHLAQYTAELATLPQGQPTAADLAAVEAMNLAAESARLAAEQAEQQRRREQMLRDRMNGRAYIQNVIEQHPLEDGAPYVVIPFSENPAFYYWFDEGRELRLSIEAADIILRHFDEQRAERNAAEDGGGYDKTDFVIHYTRDGEDNTYEGRYDLGDGDGGMLEHIRSFGRFYIERGRFGNGKPDEDSKREGAEIVELADWLESFTSGGRVVSVELAPWALQLIEQRKQQLAEQEQQEARDILAMVEMFTDEQLAAAVMSISPQDDEKRDVARFFLQKLATRDRARALEVFREWMAAGG